MGMSNLVREVKDLQVSDKNLIVVCLTAVAIVAMFKIADPATVVSNISSALAGMAVGVGLSK
jgi:hypothetical protein